MIRRIRKIIFLRDVLWVSVTAFGGPQAHLSLFLKVFVEKRGYLSEKDLLELNALCQVLPGPSSTQTITSIGFKLGGPPLAYLTLLFWTLPAFIIMTSAGILMSHFYDTGFSLEFTRFIQPMAVGFVSYAAWKLAFSLIKTKTALIIMILSAALSIILNSPFVFPVLLILSGMITTYKYKKQPKQERNQFHIRWENLILWMGVFIFASLLANLTGLLPFKIFENMYRNGSMVFGGGQVLVPFLYTEFVEFKKFLSSEEFLAGYSFVQILPGPVFSFTAYVGVLAMREYGIGGEILGAFLASAGIFLPGTFLIFFLNRFWDNLKSYRVIRASLEGITASSTGMVAAAAYMLFKPIELNFFNSGFTLATFLVLLLTKIPPPYLVIAGILAGFIFYQ